MSEAVSAYVEKYGPYLEDIRRRLYQTVLASVAAFVAGFMAMPFLLKAGIGLFSMDSVVLATTSPFQLVDLAMDTGFFFAVLCAVPLTLYHLYAFLHSGLVPGERRAFLFLIPLGLVLFVVGFLYGFAVLYYALGIIAGVNERLGVANLWDINRFVSQIALVSMLLGLVFQFPLVLVFLARMGVVSSQFLADKRRHATIVILLVSALLPPTDGLSFIVMAVPLIAMYEVTVFVTRRWGRVLIT